VAGAQRLGLGCAVYLNLAGFWLKKVLIYAYSQRIYCLSSYEKNSKLGA
jgi:hypothetical protein